MSRETYEQNMTFMQEALKRINDNQVGMDELEQLAKEFAQARAFCRDRLAKIEAGLQDVLKEDVAEQGS